MRHEGLFFTKVLAGASLSQEWQDKIAHARMQASFAGCVHMAQDVDGAHTGNNKEQRGTSP